MSILLDEANVYERGMDDDLTFQTVRELAGTAYMAGRSAPPTDAEVEAVAKRLCWNSCKKWDGIESDYVAKDEDDAWDYAGEIPGFHEEYQTGRGNARNRTEGGKRMSKTIRYVECAHCGETVGSYYVTCPYCGYRLVDAKQAVMMGLSW